MKSEFISNSSNDFGKGNVSFTETVHSLRKVILWQALKVLLWSLGIILLVWAFRNPQFRDPEGSITGAFCLPTTAAIAFFVFGSAVTTGLRKSAFWFGLAAVGQAVALQLIDAGSKLRYQHYKPFGRLLVQTDPLLVIFLAIQTVLVIAGLKSRFPEIRAWVACNFKTWQLIAVGTVFFLTSATVSRNVSVYLAELPFATFVQAVNVANILLVVLALPTQTLSWFKRKFDTLLGDPIKKETEIGAGIDRFSVWAAVWVIVLAALLNLLSYERHPHVADEVVYLYHARYLAGGMLAMPAPPVPKAFYIDLMNYENNVWYCPVPPGWPLVLALGTFFGAAWLVNPLLAGLNVLLAYSLIRQLYDRRTARIVTLLLCASPWYVFMGMNYMTHMLTMTCALAAALAVSKSRKTNGILWALFAGMAAAFVSLIRPLDGVIVAGLIGLWAIGIGGKRLKVTAIIGLVFGCLLIGALQFPYNKRLTGNPLEFPINAYNDKYHGHNSNAYGFGPDRGFGWEIDPYPGHGPIDAMINANLNITSINFELFGWSIGSLLLVTLFLFSRTMKRSDYLMLGVFGAVFVAYFFYYFSGGPDFGARYWFLVLIPFVALTVRGAQFLEKRFATVPGRASLAGVGVIVALLTLSALSLVNYFPWRAIDKYHHYLGMRPDIRNLAKEHQFGKSLVLIRGNAFPDFASAAIYNPLDLHSDTPVYAWDRDSVSRTQILKAYADRPVWIIDGPSITHSGFNVVTGPMSAEEMLSRQ